MISTSRIIFAFVLLVKLCLRAATAIFMPGVDVLVVVMETENTSEYKGQQVAFTACLAQSILDLGDTDKHSRLGVACSDKLSDTTDKGGYVWCLYDKDLVPEGGVSCETTRNGSDLLDSALLGAVAKVNDTRPTASLLTIVLAAKRLTVKDTSKSKFLVDEPNMLFVIYLFENADDDPNHQEIVKTTGKSARVMTFRACHSRFQWNFRNVLCQPDSDNVDPNVPCLQNTDNQQCSRTQTGIPRILRPDLACPDEYRTILSKNCTCAASSTTSEQVVTTSSTTREKLDTEFSTISGSVSKTVGESRKSHTSKTSVGTSDQTSIDEAELASGLDTHSVAMITALAIAAVVLIVVNVAVICVVICRRKRRKLKQKINRGNLQKSPKSRYSTKKDSQKCAKSISAGSKSKSTKIGSVPETKKTSKTSQLQKLSRIPAARGAGSKSKVHPAGKTSRVSKRKDSEDAFVSAASMMPMSDTWSLKTWKPN